MLKMGVVPFLHPEYDTQFNAVSKDDFIRVKTPEEFYKKMQYLDENPEVDINQYKDI